MVYEVIHKDGLWKTSIHWHNNRKIMIKSQRGKGIKCHVFFLDSDKVEFTLRYNFMNPEKLLQKAVDKIETQIKRGCKNKAEHPKFTGSIVELNDFLECGKCDYLECCLIPQNFMEEL